jgi:hypothetical protein
MFYEWVRDGTHCAQNRQSWKDLLQQALTRDIGCCLLSKYYEFLKNSHMNIEKLLHTKKLRLKTILNKIKLKTIIS